MAAIDPQAAPTSLGGPAAALMAVALLLPGVLPGLLPVAHAQPVPDDSADLQAAWFRDGRRSTGSDAPAPRPLTVERLGLHGSAPLDGRHTLQFGATQDTWSGATPVASAPRVAGTNRAVQRGTAGALVTVGASPMLEGRVWLDPLDRPLARGADGRWSDTPEMVHTLSTASPETRRQLDLKLLRRLDDGQLALGAGVSQERDHRARFVSLARRVDNGASTWTLGLNATRGDIAAVLDHDAAPYLDKTPQAERIVLRSGQAVHRGRRDELGASLAWTRVLGPAALLDSTLSVTQSRGDLSNPYKAVSVIFAPRPAAAAADEPVEGELRALLERRPDRRRQWNAGTRLVLHHAPSDGALHLGAAAFADDWGVRGLRLSGEWFQPLPGDAMLSLRVGHHSQSAARFYAPYRVSHQAWRRVSVAPDGTVSTQRYDPTLLPAHFSSDARLAAFGTLSAGLGYSRPLGRGVELDLSLDRSWQSGRLKWGGGGEGAWADLQHWTAQASLQLSFDGLGSTGSGHDAHRGHAGHAAPTPAGVSGVHAPRPGQWMLGLRVGADRWGGPWRDGRRRISNTEAAERGCAGSACTVLPDAMAMRMAMLELMVGVGEHTSLMLMTQHMTHRMDSALVPGAAPQDQPVHTGRHEHGGPGDTQLHAQWHGGDHGLAWALGLGLSIPTGDAGATRRRTHQQDGGLVDIGMQTGSGTWELLPTASVLGTLGPLSWGAQWSAATRLQTSNDDGYARGWRWQASAWLGTALARGIGATTRLAWRVDHGVAGVPTAAAAPLAPTDVAAQQGGRVAELGLGLNAALDAEGGARRGTLAVERLLPLQAWTRGVQLSPRGSWQLSWSHAL